MPVIIGFRIRRYLYLLEMSETGVPSVRRLFEEIIFFFVFRRIIDVHVDEKFFLD